MPDKKATSATSNQHVAVKPRVLVTRARERASGLVTELRQAGFLPLELPCIEIRYRPATEIEFDTSEIDVAVFTSYHAVDGIQHALPLSRQGILPAVLAIGPATAQRLAEYDQIVSEAPIPPFNSEALLTSATLTSGQYQRVAIIKGVGGRDFLENKLKRMGLRVKTVETYERFLPEPDKADLEAAFLNSPVDIVTITSNEMLQNLIRLAGKRFREQLLRLPLVVSSQRAASLATELGFHNTIVVAALPGNAGLLDAIRLWTHSKGGFKSYE